MNRKTFRRVLSAASAVPGAYPLLACLTARRIVVRGESMWPTLSPGERVIFDRLAYVLRAPKAGDIVLARHPSRPGVRFIKRVAEEQGVGEGRVSEATQPLGWTLLGDNPGASTDSRQLGPFRREDIMARAWLVYWPLERFRAIRSL